MNRKPILNVFLGSCIIALALSLTMTPTLALAEGGGPVPPEHVPPDSLLDSANPADYSPKAAYTKESEAQDFSFSEAVEIMIQVIF